MNGYESTFGAIYGEAHDKRGFSHSRYQKAADVFSRWMDDPRNGGTVARIRYGSQAARKQAVGEMVRAYYGVPVLGWFLWTVLGSFVSWLFQRWLDELYPRGMGCSD